MQAPPRVLHGPKTRQNSWQDVSDLAAGFGVVLDPWQETVLQAAMGERPDGQWAARQVAISAPRQNGKSEIIVARALAGILLFGEQTIIVSAHQQDTAREVFGRLLGIIEQFPNLEERVESVMRAVNREYIRFKSGQTIRFKARSTGSGRGFSCDCLLLDEAQILSPSSWSAILPTMSARPNPQAWLLGTPPTENDDGEVFERMRNLGVLGRENTVAYLEWAAESDDPIDDPLTWAKANPAYGSRISQEAVATELASMSEEQFRLERLGIWNEAAAHMPVIPAAVWRKLNAPGPDSETPPTAFGVDMSHAMQISVAAAWVVEDSIHVEEVWAGGDVAAAVQWIATAAGRRTEVVIDDLSPASQMVPELINRRVKVRKSTARDMAKGCLQFESRAGAGTVSHAGQAQLAAAVAGAKKRPIGDAGGWGWDRRDASSQIHPLVACTLALLSASSTRRRTTGERTSANRKAAILL